MQRFAVDRDLALAAVVHAYEKTIKTWLILDSRVLCDQQLNERMKQRFASLSGIVNKLEETEVKGELLL